MNIKPRHPVNTLVAYSALALPLAIAELPIILYLPAFYAKEVGLSIGLVGLVFLLARLWDGISDPLIGWFSDRSSTRFGRRKPWVLAGAPLLMVAAWFLCNPPDEVGLIYLAVWAALFYTAQTIVKVPYWSWGAELTSDYAERNKVVAFREGGSMIGNLAVASAPLLLLPNDAPVRDVLFLISIIIIVLIPLTVTPLVAIVTDQPCIKKSTLNLFYSLKGLANNGPLVRFLIIFACMQVSVGVINSVALFLIDDGLGLPNAFFSLFFIQYVTAIVAAPLVVRLANQFGKHIVLMGGLIVLLIAYLGGFMLPMGSYPLVVFFMFILGMAFSCLYILPTSILADIVDYDTAATGEEQAGIYIAVLNLVMKLGLALGVGIAYGFLDLAGYDPSAEVRGVDDVMTLRVAGYGITSVLLIPAIILLRKFPITKKVQQQLRKKIDARSADRKSSLTLQRRISPLAAVATPK